ncbi:protein kinase [Actinomadura sp. KC345]|uniref:WD40 repeat domain-containing serine/threonine protein kinase n=1 Tax=Actinomadura sp. KC345 TaxID=2530371 RepID=UPI0010439829|nr:serine/threonine-protein kinase [Actinomadura sp. KC345]TDC47474.1 protein kinase [Actinomadura sp. KC345]
MQALRPQDPPSVGPYRLERRLGEGGMGQVFLGASPGGRQVAVKLIRAEHAADAHFRARFAREVEAARRVGGFYTAQVVDADPDAAEPWMATAYVPGPSLRDQVDRDGPLTPEAVRRLGAALAEGLAAIHACGLVHRDLKPGNVIMSPDGPRIIDFGIARAADATTLTATGSVVGTYAYMAPEQIRADRAGPAADVFALGCVLAFAATGRAPFQADSVPAIVRRIVAEPPRLDGMEGDLRDLVAACLAKDPEQRPGITGIGRRLAASPAPRRVPRRALIAGAAAATAAAAIGGPTAWLLSRPDEPSAPAFRPTAAPIDSKVLVGKPLSLDSLTFIDGGAVLMAAGTEAVWHWKPSTGEHRITDMPEVLAESGVRTFSADGRVLAACQDTHVAIGDPATGRTIRRIDVPDRPTWVALNADGSRLAVHHGDSVGLWDVRTGRRNGPSFGDGHTLAFSPDGRLLAGGESADEGPIWVWDVATGRTVTELREGTPGALAFSPDGTVLAGTIVRDVRLWDARSGRTLRTMRGHTDYIDALAFSPDGGMLASGGDFDDHTIRLWNTRTGALIATLTDETDDVGTLAFSPDGRSLASATGDGTVRVRRFA